MKYKLRECIELENHEEGTIISSAESSNIICLGKREQYLFTLLLYKGAENQITVDIKEFCEKLVDLGVLVV